MLNQGMYDVLLDFFPSFSCCNLVSLTSVIINRCIRLAMVFPKCPEVVGIVGHAGQAPKAL